MIAINGNQISELEKFYRINLINSLAGYKALNLLGTMNPNGATNLCLVSSVFHLGANPPLLGLVMRPQRETNDSLNNIISTGVYTLNNVLPSFYKQAHQTSANYPSGVSEFETCGFGEHFIDGFKAPFVKESTIRMGLQLKEIIDIKINRTTIVIGEIVQILADDLMIEQDGSIDHIKAGTITVAGLDSYFKTEFLGRLSYAKVGIDVEEVKI